MLDPVELISQLCTGHGIPGREGDIAEIARKMFEPLCEETWVDDFANAWGRIGKGGPRVFICAHSDEIGMMVTEVDDKGFLRFDRVGGVDPRVLPGSEVIVHGREKLYGVIGGTPPHLQDANAQKKLYKITDLRIDIGLPVEKAQALVRTGDMVTFKSPATKLMNHMVAAKSQDDRAGVVMMVMCMEELQRAKLNCEVLFCATASEEIGLKGATVSAYNANPDVGIAIDVSHGPCPGSKEWETNPLDKVSLACGPNIHPGLLKRLRTAADEIGIGIAINVFAGGTPTDASAIQVTRMGIPTALVEIPLKYMHTTVETLDGDTVRKGGRVLARYLTSITPEGGAL